MSIADRRKEFEEATRKSGRDEDAERAFIEGKMALVRSDPNMSEQEKEKALAELRLKLERPPPGV
jgi:hypothetical protein